METLTNKCKQCNSINIEYKETEFQIGYYCNDCDIIHTEQKKHKGCCEFVDIQTMKVSTANGISYRNICQNCFTTKVILKKTDPHMGKLIEISLQDLFEKTNSINRSLLFSELLEIKQQTQESKKTAFWVNYNKYLLTDKWQNKRLKVLQRDKYLCQACLTNKATQLHHLTYERVFDEPLFDLVSICVPCHDKLHKKN
jgi:hypothetical protein